MICECDNCAPPPESWYETSPHDQENQTMSNTVWAVRNCEDERIVAGPFNTWAEADDYDQYDDRLYVDQVPAAEFD